MLLTGLLVILKDPKWRFMSIPGNLETPHDALELPDPRPPHLQGPDNELGVAHDTVMEEFD